MRPPHANRKTHPASDLRQETLELAAHGQPVASNDPDLAAVIEAWDRLPAVIRAGIVAMVNAALK